MSILWLSLAALAIFAAIFSLMNRVFYSLFFLLIFVFQGVAQQEISLDKRLLLNASNGGAEASRNKQWIYYGVVNGDNNSGKAKTNISWDLSAALSLNATAYQTTLIQLSFDQISLREKVEYRAIDISHLITPDIFSGEFQLIGTDGKVWTRPFEIQLAVDEPTSKQLSHVDLKAGSQRFQKASITNFDFSEIVQNQIEQSIQEINGYYGALNLFDSIETSLAQDLDENSPLSLFLAYDIIRKALLLNEKFFDQQIIVFSPDQKTRIQDAAASLQRKQLRYETLLTQFFQSNKPFPYSPQEMAEAYYSKLLEYKQLSTTVDFRDYEAFYNLYGMQADAGFLEKLNEFEKYFNNLVLSRTIIEVLLREINALLSKEDYANAYFLSDQLYSSGLLHTTNHKKREVAEILSLSRAGVLESYFQINNKALEANNEKMALLYFSKAREFFKTAFDNIPDDNTRLVATKLIGNYQSKANELLQQGQTDKAIQYLNQASEAAFLYDNRHLQMAIKNSLSTAHQQKFDQLIQNVAAFNEGGAGSMALLELEKADSYYNQNADYISNTAGFEKLKQALGEPIFSDKIQSGMNAARQGNTDEALKNLAEANQLESQNIYASHNEGKVTNELAKPLIIEKIRTANKQVWANKLDEAWEIYHDAQLISEEFRLQNDPEIAEVFSKLDARIIERICMNNQQSYDELMLAADRAVRLEKISDLQNALAEARKLVDKNRGCNIQTEALVHYEKLFESSFDYWERYQNMLDIMYASGFEAAIPTYLELDQQAALYDLSELGNPHQDMHAFLSGQQNPTLTALATNYFIAQGDYQSAKKYFHLFISQNPDSKIFKSEIENAARVFAAFDAQISEGRSVEDLLQDYDAQVLNYKDFIKNYKRSF